MLLLSSNHLLVLSGSCYFHAYPFNRSVVPFCSSSFRLINHCISFQPEYFLVLLVHQNPFLMSFKLQGSSNVPCSSFLTECFQLCSSLLYSFFQVDQDRKVHGFTHLSKKQLVLPLLFLFRCPSGAILNLGTRSSRSGGVL